MKNLLALNLVIALVVVLGCGSETSSTSPSGSSPVVKSAEANVLSWKFGSDVASIDQSAKTITVTFPFATDVSKLAATATWSSNGSIQPDPAIATNYAKPQTFTVTAEDGKTKKAYTVSVVLEPAITSWTGGWRNANAFTATIDHSAGTISIDVDSADFETKVNLAEGVALAPDPKTVDNWTNAVSFTASKGSARQTYKVKVTVNGKDIIKVTNANIKATCKGAGNCFGRHRQL